MTKFSVFLILLCCFLFNSSFRTVGLLPVHDDMRQITKNRIEELINTSIRQNIFPGAVVLVANKGHVIFRKAYGYSQTIPKKVKMTDSTLFDIASLSKCIATAPAVMKLIEEGKIRLYDPVDRYIMGFKPWTNGKDSVRITIQQLLSHSSGLDAGLSITTANKLRNVWKGANTASFVNYIALNSKRNFRPGTKSLYSCLNYIVLQGIVEKITKMRLCDYVAKQIFHPIGMNNSFYFCENDSTHLSHLIASTELMPNGKPLNGVVHDPLARLLNGGNSGNAGVFTNADDIARFCLTLLEGKHFVFSENTTRLMVSRDERDYTNASRSLGWELNSSYAGGFRKHRCICHTGYTGTSIVIDLEAQVVVVLLTNRVHPYDGANQKNRLMSVRRQLSNIICEEVHV